MLCAVWMSSASSPVSPQTCEVRTPVARLIGRLNSCQDVLEALILIWNGREKSVIGLGRSTSLAGNPFVGKSRRGWTLTTR